MPGRRRRFIGRLSSIARSVAYQAQRTRPRPMGTKDNQFLSSLNEADMALLSPHLREMVDLPHTRVLFEQGGRIERLYFPVSGVVSFVVAMSDGEWVEAGMVGRDGVVGGSAGLDGARALNRAIVQSPGKAFAIE